MDELTSCYQTNMDERDGKKKKFGPFLDLCVSSLRRGHANLLCIVPILSDVPEGTRVGTPCPLYKASKRFHSGRCGIDALAIFWLDSAVFFPNDNKLTISFVNQLRIYERHEDEQNFIVRYTSTDMG
ncbi:hypothetical protein Tco_0861128 [Tanacetum coccineum]|uniref:Uncharacterized protein n=1 Tax=Tanacetum coccineum TaxID=301880 RepID=A0ABQ5BKA0_9ASTR